MCRPVSSCGEETSLSAAARLMEENDCGALPVMKNGRLVGIVTDRDMCLAITRPSAADTPVREVMTSRVATCKADDDVRVALATMAARQVRRLPVLDERGGVAGILSMDDVVLRAEEPDPSRLPPDVSCRDVVRAMQQIYGTRRVRPAAARSA